MNFRFYTNMISQASRTVAATIFVVGLVLIGFGMIIVALPEIFAYLAAILFFISGFGCGITALRIFLAQRRLEKLADEETSDYKESIEIFNDRYTDDDS
ncbi:MAG: hypothetical protein A2167_05145 [Planctomycetes bacterium RBG_13_46_10]|nr:MAG: hypothetical protein A2167_05145 [Planctomycetes bacterium RBG_13_46_10]